MSDAQPPADERKYWLDDPANIKTFIRGFFVVCGLVLVADIVHQTVSHRHNQGPKVLYAIENVPGFYAFYGLVACVLLVVLAKYLLRPAVMRDEDYYD